ncbi:GntR family transcriptional regulator [Frigidibacter sp. MR17.14]|uniref:GntR family transcriptional regulator n=1 Tax=Frigidibacter sp. MR17.14 TaxID=3126509 RepID=UPI003012AB20
MTDRQIRPLEPAPSLTEQVYAAISAMLLDGTLRPDGRSSIRELAETLGVSTMPVREAVGRLVAQGALVVHRNRAVAVPRYTEAGFLELTRTRILLEGEAARQAAIRVTGPERTAIEALHEAFAAALAKGSAAEALVLNRRLHFALYDAARAPMLRQLIGIAWLKAGPFLSLDVGASAAEPADTARGAHSVSAHAAIVAALGTGDGAAASAAVASDIAAAARTILARDGLFEREETEDGSGT